MQCFVVKDERAQPDEPFLFDEDVNDAVGNRRRQPVLADDGGNIGGRQRAAAQRRLDRLPRLLLSR